MEKFKIENFKKDNPEKDFPRFDPLTSDEAQEILIRLSERIGKAVQPDQLVKMSYDHGTLLTDTNATNKGFRLESVLSGINIYPNEKVYINWYRFDDIDEIRFTDLNKNFDDIWYPSSDDIDIFDATFSWLLSISHDGTVKYLSIKEDVVK